MPGRYLKILPKLSFLDLHYECCNSMQYALSILSSQISNTYFSCFVIFVTDIYSSNFNTNLPHLSQVRCEASFTILA